MMGFQYHAYKPNVDCTSVENMSFLPVVYGKNKGGVFSIMIEGKRVGEVDVCFLDDGFASVSVQLVDTFLTIEQMMNLMNDLKKKFNLPKDQRVSIEQV